MIVLGLADIVIPSEVSAHKDYDRIRRVQALADIKMKVEFQHKRC